MVTEVLNGVWIGHRANEFRRNEESALIGVNNRLTTGLLQIASLYNSLYICDIALQANNLKPLSSLASGALYLTPILVNYASSRVDIKDHPTLKRSLLFVNASIGPLCQVAIVISSLYLVTLGQPLLGSATLVFLGLGFAQRHRLISNDLAKKIDYIGLAGSSLAAFIFGSYIDKAFSLLELGFYLYAYKLETEKKVQIAPKKYVADETIQITDLSSLRCADVNKEVVSINPSHTFKGLPPITVPPDITVENLKEMASFLNPSHPIHEKSLKAMREKTYSDQHWIEYYGHLKSDQDIIIHLKKGIKNFVEIIKAGGSSTGFINDRTVERARCVTYLLSLKEEEDLDRVYALIDLALASYYCPAGYADTVTALYSSLSARVDSLDSQLFMVLNQERMTLFQSLLHFLYGKNPFIDINDQHTYNALMNLIGQEFQIDESIDSNEDSLSFVSVLDQKIAPLIFGSIIAPFKASYNQAKIREALLLAIKNGQISYLMMEKWFSEKYIEEEIASGNLDKEASQKSLDKAIQWVQENVVDDVTYLIRQEYLDFFLIKMGVFTLNPEFCGPPVPTFRGRPLRREDFFK